ncbi:hypothetical protein ABZX12_04295 [Kribbella sp. NPDC003505]|uniref:hypothetical protein n=1 Tax=Kribbella sp. NPDC003505 TaxID=3154448 RepID=UPI0033AAE057
MGRWGRNSAADRLEAAQEQLKAAKQHQKDLRELVGMPGYKEAVNYSARNIAKAEEAVRAALKAVRIEQLEAAQQQLEAAKQHQKDLRELVGMPGYKEAVNYSGRNIAKAEKAVRAAKKAARNER